MGCFDSVFHACPWCGMRIESQSKTGECMLAIYDVNTAPKDVMWGLTDPQDCEECGEQYFFDFEICPTCNGKGSWNLRIEREYSPR